MQIDDTMLTAIGAAISGGFLALWLQVRTQINDLRSQLKDAVKRIRELEDERRSTLVDVAKTNKALIFSLRQRPCMSDQYTPMPSPDNLPDAETSAITMDSA